MTIEPKKTWEDEMNIRKYLWLNHGCHPSQVYGDDGEMQCHGCDFKRMPINGLITHCFEWQRQEIAREVEGLKGFWHNGKMVHRWDVLKIIKGE